MNRHTAAMATVLVLATVLAGCSQQTQGTGVGAGCCRHRCGFVGGSAGQQYLPELGRFERRPDQLKARQ